MVPRWAIGIFCLFLLVSVSLSVWGTSQIVTFKQNAEKMAFVQSLNFQGQNTAPFNISTAPASVQMEVKGLLPASAFVQK